MQYIFAPWEQYDPREDERRFDARMRQLYQSRMTDQKHEAKKARQQRDTDIRVSKKQLGPPDSTTKPYLNNGEIEVTYYCSNITIDVVIHHLGTPDEVITSIESPSKKQKVPPSPRRNQTSPEQLQSVVKNNEKATIYRWGSYFFVKKQALRV